MAIVGTVIEERLDNYVRFEADKLDHVTFSGIIHISAQGVEDDDEWAFHPCQLVVGPWWTEIDSATPLLHVNFWNHSDADEDDNSGFHISGIHCDDVGGTGPHDDDRRLRILCEVEVRGENARVESLGYFVHAKGHLAKDWQPEEPPNF